VTCCAAGAATNGWHISITAAAPNARCATARSGPRRARPGGPPQASCATFSAGRSP